MIQFKPNWSDIIPVTMHETKPKRKLPWLLLSIPAAIILVIILYQLPPIKERVRPRIEALRSQIIYALNPPDQAVFIPQEQQEQIKTIVQSTLAALTPSPTLSLTPILSSPTPTPTSPGPTNTPIPTLTPTITPTPLPDLALLDGVVYVDQHNRWNYCGPANLTMALNYWGWTGDRDDVAAVVKPGVIDPDLDFIQSGKYDKNVMPYEMARFVEEFTEYNVVVRIGGEIELLKRLIANGIPVLVEKGYYEADYTGKVAWMGHYLFTTGYDESKGVFIVQDAYLEPGMDMESEYQTYLEGWRSFNYLFMVIYPPEQEARVYDVLGQWGDPAWANQNALDIANQEIQTLTGIDEFFAWFNKGTSHVSLLQYADASIAYDYAFQIYSQLVDDDSVRPYRIMWYQTSPYWAYFYTERYQDTINLANYTLFETISDPTLEESLYWRGRAYLAIGETDNAIADFRESVRLNPTFAPGIEMLNQLGVNP